MARENWERTLTWLALGLLASLVLSVLFRRWFFFLFVPLVLIRRRGPRPPDGADR